VPLYGDDFLDDSGYDLAFVSTGTIEDRSSLEQSRRAYRTRGERGIADLRAQLHRLESEPGGGLERAMQAVRLRSWIAGLCMSESRFEEAETWLTRAIEDARAPGMPRGLAANLTAMRGVASMRRGETENCVQCIGPSSCILPLSAAAVHRFPTGSRAAARDFTAYLRERPEDAGVRWLLNVVSMTLGDYPARVPPEFLMPVEPPGSARRGVGRFANVAAEAGLGVRGPNMAGGSVFDDFDGDGRPDLFTTSLDPDLGASLYVNRGDGRFDDRSEAAGLAAQGLAVNAEQADFDNDGDLDVVLLRGGWEDPLRLSLLRNDGRGVFEDITASAGLAGPIASHSAAWGDYDRDGLLDLFVCGEFLDRNVDGLFVPKTAASDPDARNHCRLYKNLGDGTFRDVAAEAGVLNERFAKGAVWGDYDDDGDLDLYVSNMGGPNRLYQNQGDGTFRDVAPDLGLTGPTRGFACWFWDYDNDGRLDLFASSYMPGLSYFAAEQLGRPHGAVEPSRLYRNLGEAGFRDVTVEAGLDRVLMPMGANFGDVDGDGYLDFYVGTGRPAYSTLVPNRMFRNAEGRGFEDVTIASGTGHLQKGHGISFADYDDDGDLDLFAELGGAVPGDQAHNALFRNPGPPRHWLKVRLVGTRSNRSAIGARIRVDRVGADGETRSVYRQIGGDSSYGGNSLVETVGLAESDAVSSLTVTWPSGLRQTFRDLPADRLVEVTEGRDAWRTPDRGGPSDGRPGVAGGPAIGRDGVRLNP
jgi:hypothetical protein